MTIQGVSKAELQGRIDSVQWPTGFETYNTTAGAQLQISFNFETSRPDDLRATSWTDVGGWGSYTAAEKVAVRAALDEYEKYLNVQFVETDTENAVDLTFLRASYGLFGGRGRFQYNTYPSFEYDGFMVFNVTKTMSSASNFDLLLHEIGHGLSLKHPGNYDVNPANAPPGPYLPADEDNRKFSIMSYNNNPELSGDPQNLMLYDIAALQERWGQNTSYRTGDDTYSVRADGNLYTIWDAGGIDTIDASGSINSTIDLGEGRFSNIDGIDRIAVAYDTIIENAIGGRGTDRISGNGAANSLNGGEGADIIVGGDGDDTLDGGSINTAEIDVMYGGVGNDTYIVNSVQTALDIVNEDGAFAGGASDVDTVISKGAFWWDYYNVAEILTIDATAASGAALISGEGDSTINGNDTTNFLLAYGGSNEINPGKGIDVIGLDLLGLAASFNGVNTIRLKPGDDVNYIYNFESLTDKVVVSAYTNRYADSAQLYDYNLADTTWGSFVYLGEHNGQSDYLAFVGTFKADLDAGDFVV